MRISSTFINKQESGFTLVELLIAMMVALLVSAAIFASYKVQQQTHTAQMQVTEIQQNLRAAMEMMSREFKMVGYDPTWSGNYGIKPASDATNFQFTADLCDNGEDPLAAGDCPSPGPYGGQNLTETYHYQLYTPGTGDDDDTFSLRRLPNGQAIADNIEFIEFFYILENGTGTLAPTAPQIPDVRSVRVTLVARADNPDFKYTNTDTYPKGSDPLVPASNYNPADDNFRRRSLIRTIELRNVGIL